MPVLSKYVNPGDRVDICLARQKGDENPQYRTRVFDVVSDDEIKLNMPMEGSRLVLLTTGREYEMCFFTSSGLFQCNGIVRDRYKSNNVFVVTLELTTGLRKFQRREYYRLNCILEMKCTELDENQEKQFNENVEFLDADVVMENGIIVDISGGGIRYISGRRFPKDTKVFFRFNLMVGARPVEFKVVGTILESELIPNRAGAYQNRVMFLKMGAEERECIIRYIFEEERKIRRKESGNS